MIKATELRIENLLQCQFKADGPLHTITITGVKDNLISWNAEGCCPAPLILLNDSYSAIPLTEEWLERLGFEFLHNGKPRRWCHSETRWFDLSQFGSGYEMAYLNMPSTMPVQFVHQLQNLFFALTGEELTIKP